eukprot:2561568-Karenia_brevis.AAC.1
MESAIASVCLHASSCIVPAASDTPPPIAPSWRRRTWAGFGRRAPQKAWSICTHVDGADDTACLKGISLPPLTRLRRCPTTWGAHAHRCRAHEPANILCRQNVAFKVDDLGLGPDLG